MSQKQEKFRVSAKTALLKRGMTVTDLSQKIRKSRVATSMAINRGVYPETVNRIKSELDLK